MADYDAKNPAALARLLKQGVKLQKYPDDVLKGAFKASEELYAEESAKNPLFKKIYASWAPFRNNEARWMSIAEAPLDCVALGAGAVLDHPDLAGTRREELSYL